MRHSKGMGLGAMFVLLVIVIVLLPMFVRFVERMTAPHFAIQGFQGGPNTSPSGPTTYSGGPSTEDGGVAGIPAIGSTSKLPTWRPDPNTDYLCRSPNEDGLPCPEGMFCDGSDQRCKPTYVGGPVPSTGYYA
jgi:hypothetical protein